MKHVEIPWSLLNKIIEVQLKLGGIDPKKETVNWCKWENDRMTLVYEQEEDAELTREGKIEQALVNRPAYLNRYNN